MASDSDKRLQRMMRLVDASTELLAKQHDLLIEMGKIGRGEKTLGVLTREATDAWNAAWNARYKGNYSWHGDAKHQMPALQKFIRSLGVDEVKSRMLRFLKDDDAFYVTARHPFSLFSTNINRYTAEHAAPLTLDAPVVSGCKHAPACTSDQQHTRQLTADRRAGSDRRSQART